MVEHSLVVKDGIALRVTDVSSEHHRVAEKDPPHAGVRADASMLPDASAPSVAVLATLAAAVDKLDVIMI